MRARITLLLVLAGCGGTTLVFEDTEDVRESLSAAYMPFYVSLFAMFQGVGGGSPEGCPAVTRQGDDGWLVEGNGCVESDSGLETTYDGRIELENFGDSGLAPGEEGTIRFVDFRATAEDGSFTEMDGRMEVADVGDSVGTLRGDITVESRSESGDTGLFAEGRWHFSNYEYRSPSADLGGGESYDLKTRVASDRGSYEVEGSASMGDDCEGEPVRGQMELRGSNRVTVQFDGGQQCDGKTPVTGDLTGEIDWQGAYPLACATGPAGASGALALLGLLLVRRRRT